MGDLPPDLQRIFAELAEQEGGTRAVELSAAYLGALREIEQLPCNQPGQDKSWVLRVEEQRRRFFRAVRHARGA